MKATTPLVAPKILKGFVLVKLSEAEKRELRKLAHTSGLALRDAIMYALLQVREDLRSAAALKQKTGMTKLQWTLRMGSQMDYTAN